MEMVEIFAPRPPKRRNSGGGEGRLIDVISFRVRYVERHASSSREFKFKITINYFPSSDSFRLERFRSLFDYVKKENCNWNQEG